VRVRARLRNMDFQYLNIFSEIALKKYKSCIRTQICLFERSDD